MMPTLPMLQTLELYTSTQSCNTDFKDSAKRLEMLPTLPAEQIPATC